MNVLFYTEYLPFDNTLNAHQTRLVIESLVKKYSLFLLLPFSEHDVLVTSYSNLKKNNIYLPDYLQTSNFVLYHQGVSLAKLNQVIFENKIDYFVNLYKPLPLILSENYPNCIHCESIVWNYHSNIPNIELFNHIIINHNQDSKKIILNDDQQLSICLPLTPSLKDFDSTRDRISIRKVNGQVVFVNLDMSNEMSIKTITNIWKEISCNEDLLFLYSNNSLKRVPVQFTIPNGFNLGDKLEVPLDISDYKVEIDTKDKNYQIGKTYKIFQDINLIELYLHDKCPNEINISYYKNNDDIDWVYYILSKSSKYIDLSEGDYFETSMLILTQNYNIPAVILDNSSNQKYVLKGTTLKTKEIQIGNDKNSCITVYDENDLRSSLDSVETTHNLPYPDTKFTELIQNTRFNDFCSKIVSTKCLENDDINLTRILKYMNVDVLHFLGNPCRTLLSKLALDRNNINEIKIFTQEKFGDIDNKLISYGKKQPKISNIITDEKFQLEIDNTKKNYLIVKIGNNYDDLINTNLKNNIIQKLILENDSTYELYGVIYQDKKKIEEYSNIDVNKQVIITEFQINDRILEIENLEKVDYSIDFFYGVSSEEISKHKTWFQEMVSTGYLDIKHQLGSNTGDFARFFRHIILWEEIYRNNFQSVHIKELDITDTTTNISVYPEKLNIPDVDIVFFDNPFNMKDYCVTNRGVRKLLQYCKPIKLPLPIHIQQVCLSRDIFYYLKTGLTKEKLELGLKIKDLPDKLDKKDNIVESKGSLILKYLYCWFSWSFYKFYGVFDFMLSPLIRNVRNKLIRYWIQHG